MAVDKGYKQVMQAGEAQAEFEVEGNGLFVMSRVVGTWTLSLVAPDGDLITLNDNISKPYQTCYQNAPKGTTLRLHGGTSANAWIGLALVDYQGLLS